MAEISSRLKRMARAAAAYAAITVVTLAILDVVLIALGLFPPTVTPGHAEVGWVSAPATGEMVKEGCVDPGTGQVLRFTRNEDGLRTSHSRHDIIGSDLFKVAVSGDSHTELCAINDEVHFGVTERELEAAGVPAAVFAFGAGKYSPLQAYLAVRPAIRESDADAFVLNFYTGNDFYDMLRIDDRPHFVPEGDGYALAPPIWYQEDPPGTVRRSRVLHVLRTLGVRTGISRAWVRVRYLNDVAAAQGEGMSEVVAYMNDLRRASVPELVYPQAFVAQMLNQQLFFHHFPGSEEESRRRVRALLEFIRAENPDRMLVLSPVPSYQLVYGDRVSESFVGMLERLPVANGDGVAQEQELHDLLESLAEETGWLFVGHLDDLRTRAGEGELYNHADYHIEREASEIIGANQARAILAQLESSE